MMQERISHQYVVMRDGDRAVTSTSANNDSGASTALLRALAAASDATTVSELADGVLGCMQHVAAFDTACVADVAPTDRPGRSRAVSVSWPAEFFAPDQQVRFEQLHQADPWILAAHSRTEAPGPPLRISDRMTQRQYRDLPIYSELFLGLEVEHQVAFGLPRPGAACGPHAMICLVLNRGGRDFSDRDIENLDLLRRPLSAVVAATRRRLDDEDPGVPVTAREAAVLDLLVDGGSNQQIAHQLGISARTVEKHLEHIYAKTGGGNRTQVSTWWLTSRSRRIDN